MKYIGWLIFIILCFPAGQVFHRIADLSSLGEGGGGESSQKEQEFIFDEEGRPFVVRIDPKTIVDEELPAKVTLKRQLVLSSPDGASMVTLETGDTVRLVSKDGGNLTVSALAGPLQGLIAMEHTDCLEQVVKIRGAQVFGGTPPAIAAVDPPQKEPVTPAPVEPAPTPPPVAQVDPPAPPVEPTPAEPEPTPVEPEPAPAKGLGPDAIVAAMKENIEGGALKEFTLNQVQDWKSGEEEDIDGETYQTGLVAYKAETIFGEKTVQAKALFKEGKIVKWVYAKTGMEIR